MNKKFFKIINSIILLILINFASGLAEQLPKEMLFMDPAQPIEMRVNDLVSRMTLEEKISQMMNRSAAIPRLGIPEYNWWNEALHGVARAGVATVFPQAIGMGATFDDELVFRVASAISDEARAKYNVAQQIDDRSQYHGLTFWTPNINIFRDPRWGRGQETYGEDPFLTSVMGSQFIKGLQGYHPHYLKAAACAKHYAVHSGPEELRHEFNAVVSKRDLYDTYLPAFHAAVNANVEAVMGAYNRTLDEPCCASKLLLQDILRGEWGFKGHVVSDCGAIGDIHMFHKYTKSAEQSAALAVNMGCDLECGGVYHALRNAVDQKLVTEKTIDERVKTLFTTRFKLGMFDPAEMVPFNSISADVINSDTHRKLAREAAVKSIVMLKNKDNILPLKKDLKGIYVIGPMAADIQVLLGNYYGLNPNLVTILEGITTQASIATNITYTPGALLDRTNPNPVDWFSGGARSADVTIAVVGISGMIEGEEGESISSLHKGDRDDIGLPANQLAFLKKMRSNAKKLVVVVTGGSPIAMPEVQDFADAILFVWYPGEEGGNAVADVLFGNESPSGRLPITFPSSNKQLPPYEDYNMQGRTYRYMTETPLYPFGFGLSYTHFEYSDLKLDQTKIKKGETVKASVTVTNKGAVSAEEVIQLYITDVKASVTTPLYSLEKFKRVNLAPAESKEITFVITPEMMSIINNDGKQILESGDFKLSIGGCSPGIRGVELGAAVNAETVFSVL